jgi:cysteine desulfurase
MVAGTSGVFFLDHCGSTPMAPEVIDAYKNAIEKNIFANSMASHHELGRHAHQVVETSRQRIARVLDVSADRVIFTSTATEANNLVIQGYALRYRKTGCRILYSAIEHKSAFESARSAGRLGAVELEEIPVDSSGHIVLDHLESRLHENPRRIPTLMVIMMTNNEMPIRQPYEQIIELAKKYNATLHCDAVQDFVREPIHVNQTGLGSVVISPHKIYGPKGIGILVFGDSFLSPPIARLLCGGDQEFGMRPGTVATPLVEVAAVAMEHHERTRVQLIDHLKACDAAFTMALKLKSSKVHFSVPLTTEAPGIVSFYFERVNAMQLMQQLPHVCINRGASCLGSGGERYSHVPKAIGLPEDTHANVLRASFGWGCSVDDVVLAAMDIVKASKSF